MSDGQTDTRTPGDSKDRAYASHHAVKMWAAVRENGDFFALAVRITGKLLKIDGCMLRGI